MTGSRWSVALAVLLPTGVFGGTSDDVAGPAAPSLRGAFAVEALDPQADMARIAASEADLWAHAGDAAASWGAWGEVGYVAPTGASAWGRPWLLGEVSGQLETPKPAEDESFWVHVSAAGASWGHWNDGIAGAKLVGRPWRQLAEKAADDHKNASEGTPLRAFWVHVGHTGATWGQPAVTQLAEEDASQQTEALGSAPGPEDEFWVHVGQEGAAWGIWGHPMRRLSELDESAAGDAAPAPKTNETSFEIPGPEDEFWLHVGHTGATWGFWGGGGHIDRAPPTWGRPSAAGPPPPPAGYGGYDSSSGN